MPGLFDGMAAALRGAWTAPRHRAVREAYLGLIFAMFALGVAASALGLYALFEWTDPAAASAWSSAGWWTLRILGSLVVLVVAPLLAVFISNLCFPLFAELPFMAALGALRPERARQLAALPGLPWHVALGINLRRLCVFVLLSGGCFALGFVPFVGPFVALPLSFVVAARSLGWELLDPYLSRRGLGLMQQKAYLKLHFWPIFGFGLVAAAALAIPLVGPLFFGVLQAAAAELVAGVLEPAPDDGR